MEPSQPPERVNNVVKLIRSRFDRMSERQQQIGRYLAHNPTVISDLSGADIAKHCQVHASTLVRFSQSLGFKGVRDLKASFVKECRKSAFSDVSTSVHVTRNSLKSGGPTSIPGQEAVTHGIALACSCLTNIVKTQLAQVAELLETANIVYLVAGDDEFPVIEYMRAALNLNGKIAIHLRLSDETSDRMISSMRPDDLVIAITGLKAEAGLTNLFATCHANSVPSLLATRNSLSTAARKASIVIAFPPNGEAGQDASSEPLFTAWYLMQLFRQRGYDGSQCVGGR